MAAIYKHRKSILESERTYTLDDQTLAWSEDGVALRAWNLCDIKSVNMRYDPTRFEADRYKITLEHKWGHTLTLSNMSYRGIADFEDRSSSYLDFVRSLHDRLASQASATLFQLGVSPAKYILYWVFTAFVGLVLIAASVMFFTMGVPWLALVKLVIVRCCYS